MSLDLSAFLATHNPELVHLRRHLHAHPELGKAERQTTALVARRLEAVGLRPRLLSMGTGLVCDVGDGDGPTVALRADIDALPLQDEKDVAYRSTIPGVCHACGHDVHTTVLLGAGLALAQFADRLPGRVRLVFQPAEEILPGGSIDVIGDRVLDGVNVIYALHCDPKLEVGRLGVRVGAITAASDLVEVQLSGPGGHTARPHLTADLVYAIARVVTDLPAALSRIVDTRAALNITFGSIESGTVHNAIPTTAVARGTLRVLDRAVWGEAQKLVERVLEATVAPFPQVTHRLDYQRGAPPVVNDETATAIMATAARSAIGDEAVMNAPQSMGGEDFSWYLEDVPGAMARLGVRISGTDLDLHAASFDVDERAIAFGVRILVATALQALEHYGAAQGAGRLRAVAPGRVGFGR
ncbi:MAG TPA: amidohydrolase [Actinomycetes bacterium]|nr:amidohydrolase [Actinomycetes bacterium]